MKIDVNKPSGELGLEKLLTFFQRKTSGEKLSNATQQMALSLKPNLSEFDLLFL